MKVCFITELIAKSCVQRSAFPLKLNSNQGSALQNVSQNNSSSWSDIVDSATIPGPLLNGISYFLFTSSEKKSLENQFEWEHFCFMQQISCIVYLTKRVHVLHFLIKVIIRSLSREKCSKCFSFQYILRQSEKSFSMARLAGPGSRASEALLEFIGIRDI